MLLNSSRLFLFLTIFVFITLRSSAEKNEVSPIVLYDSISEYDIINNMEYLPDSLEQWTIEDVASEEFSVKYKSLPRDSGGRINFRDKVLNNLQTKVLWGRFSLSPMHSFKNFLIHHMGDTVMLYYRDSLQNFRSKISGNRIKYHDRDFPLATSVQILLPPIDSVTTFYFKLINSGKGEFYFYGKIQDMEKVLKAERQKRFIQALLSGIFIALICYNLMLYISLKDQSYLYYILYLFTFGLFWFSANGYSFEYLWPDYPQLNNLSLNLGLVFCFFYVLFGKTYLRTNTILPKWNIALMVHLVGLFFCAAIIYSMNYLFRDTAFGGDSILIDILGIISVVWIGLTFFIVLIPAIHCWRKGYHPARYFLFANVLLIGGIATAILLAFLETNTVITEFSIQMGAAAEVLVFSLGLGKRFNLLQQEKEQAQQKIIEQLKENELLQLTANRELEEKVQERTKEISHQKNIIEKAHQDISEKNKEILDSIHYAKRIQRALLASDNLLKRNLKEYFILYKPKDIVSGDFYWASEIKGEQGESQRFLLCTADCTGHGVPGAFMSLLNISLLNESTAVKNIFRADAVLNYVRENIIHSLNPEGTAIEGKDGMDCALCSFDFKNMSLEFSCANNPLWVIRGGELIEKNADKMPVGMFKDRLRPFTLQYLELKKGDLIYTFTDGYSDQFGGPKGKKFKRRQLKEKLLSIASLPMNQQMNMLDEMIESWKGSLQQVDDICVIGVKI